MEKQFNCPECGSDRTQKAKILYETGASALKTTTAGIGAIGGGNVGVGIAATTGSSQTELSKNLSPPAKAGLFGPPVFCIMVGIIIFVIAIAFAFSPNRTEGLGIAVFCMLLGGGFGIVGYRGMKRVNDKRASYNDEYAKWERLWYCSRCGHTFYVE